MSDFSQIRANGISLTWSHHIPTKSRDPSHTFFLSFSPASSRSRCSESTFTSVYLISLRTKVCHVYKFTFPSFAGPPRYPVVFLNGDDVSILLLHFCWYCFKTGNSPVLPFTVKLWQYLRCYSLHVEDFAASCYMTWNVFWQFLS